MSNLRDPERDPDYMLPPKRLVALEEGAEGARARLAELDPAARELVRLWIASEMEVARRRAHEVDDIDFVECVSLIERRLTQVGAFLRDAQLARDLERAFDVRASLRVLDGGRSAAARFP